MTDSVLNERFERAVKSEDATQSLYDLALELKNEGYSQTAVYDLFDSYRAKLAAAESPEYNIVLDIMGLISGWCHPEKRIFDCPHGNDQSG